MTKREYYSTRKDGVKLYKTYSDNGFKIKKVGTNEVYDEAIDVESATFEYEETEEKVQKYDNTKEMETSIIDDLNNS